MPYFGVPTRNGLPLGLGTVASLASRATAAVVSVTDAFFRYVSLLLNTSATNGAQNNTFLDSSANNFSITRNGNTTQGTFSPFSQTGWSNYFDGTGDYLSISGGTPLNFGTGDFTVEGWAYGQSTSTNGVFQISSTAGGLAPTLTTLGFLFNSSGKWEIYTSAGNITSTANSLLNQWVHFAVVRASSVTKLYINGSEVISTSDTGNYNYGNIAIGGAYSTSFLLFGYVSNLRAVKGTAVYTANFTPPTAPLTNITNTSLLTCQSNRFIDNSSNAFAITRNGDVAVQAFSPFSPTAAWSASTNGGSGYFDGTGDYLTAPDNAAFDFGSGAFTVELWYYPTSIPAITVLVSKWNAGTYAGTNQWLLYLNGAAAEAFISIDGTSIASTITGPNVLQHQWNHVAFVRNGNSFTVYTNGVGGTSVTNAGSLYALDTEVLGIGYRRNNGAAFEPLFGYTANIRIVKGTAVYTANFTPPTAPLTAITNTSLLLNFTNAGIFDSAAGNDLETVGNAQVSTAQAKWGTTSMAFDGTGDWLVMPTSNKNTFGSGDFTIELWVYFSALPTSGVFANLIDFRPTGVNGLYPTLYVDGTTKALKYFVNNVDRISGSSALNSATWYHIAISRSGSNTRLFLNGTQEGSTYADTNSYITGSLRPVIGANGFDTSLGNFNGYIDDLRITNGYARYTANFTAPTAAFPLQ